MNKYKELRLKCFGKIQHPDDKFMDIVKDTIASKLFKSLPIYNIYLYLIEYLLTFSTKWFDINSSWGGVRPDNNKNLKLLDWGCGCGAVSYLLKKRGVDVISADIHEYDQSTKSFNIDYVALRHEYILPFDNETFDVVCSFGVLEHVPNDIESLREIRRVLKPNGLFFCFHLPQKYSYIHRINHLLGDHWHDRLYNKKTISKLLLESEMKLLDLWQRALLPKNRFPIPSKFVHFVDRIDNFICFNTVLKYFATNIEFVACKLPY